MPEQLNSVQARMTRSFKGRHNLRQIATILSLLVILAVFWSLKLTGIGIAGEAFCGKPEHVHSEKCRDPDNPCTLEEHVHDATCYSNINADLETSDDWELTLADMVRGPTTRENLVLVARSQLGYTESTLNFQVDGSGVRRGITRYGQWYGNPYGDWSAMFASFCLHYAGAEGVPFNAGPESMRLEWEAAGLYRSAQSRTPEVGTLIFLGTSQRANAVAIVTGIEGSTLTVIQGDVDNTVTEAQYRLDDSAILGYGLVPESEGIILLDEPALTAETYTIWLDGTDGGMGHLTGSPNTAYTADGGSTIKLPADWTSPSKYAYKLRGWYDVVNSRYYPPGGEMEVTGNTVLYADWVAATYDIGQFNAQVADTVSTSQFITTHMFDYNYLFNIHSSKAEVTVSASDHSERWSMVTSGAVHHGSAETFDFVFIDNDSGGLLCTPNNRSSHNYYPGAGIVTPNIYSAALGDLLFATDNCFDPATGTGVLGKNYLGTGDHLFQIMDDPTDEHYGYYYYDSKRNAASYHQTNRRFYVYDYLAATSDAIGSTYSDFLPLNSPYANTNGKTVSTYNHNGVNGEYAGVPHYRYDSKYNSGNYNSTNNVQTDYAYGMRTDIKFYLPNDPGTGGNKDLYGNDMQFQFSGDDDLWVLIDGQLVLDIGGIHGAEEGVIDFSTGIVTVQGDQQTSLMDFGIGAGDHTLSVLYLERGSSLSNCSIYFNMAPRYGLELQKEDVLTQELLNGAQFTIYEDLACTEPAQLWDTEGAYNQDILDGVLDEAKSTFTVTNGVVRLWGLGSGNTYYIKETGPPSKEGYGTAEGVIRLTIEKGGQATYHADVVADADGNGPSNGFTVHGEKIDEETQTVYLVVTNAPETVLETTTVQVIKKWEDTADHSDDYITAYLTVTDPDGTVRRIRQITLSDQNRWMHTWTNLPKYDYDNLREIRYGIEESYESGYYSTVRQVTQIEISTTEWAEAASFVHGDSYILKTGNGYLSTTSASDGKLKWVDEKTAQGSPLATWSVTISSGKIRFTNGAGQILTFNNGRSSSSRYFYATTGSSTYQTFTAEDAGSGFRLYVTRSWSSYYMTTLNQSTGRISSATSNRNAMILTPMKKITQTDIQQVQDWAYQITNTPLEAHNETSMTVKKEWVVPEGYDATLYQEFAVTVRLLANGVDTGRTLTLTLKNGWQGIFQGLPCTDANGNVIQYTVVENWEKERWTTTYEPIRTTGDNPPAYTAVITNTYRPGGPELPSTGSAARLTYLLCGTGMLLLALVLGLSSRRKRERRMDDSSARG